VRVWDKYNHDIADTTVTVNNVAPDLDAQADQPADEGATVSRLVTFIDPGADAWDVTVDWDDGTAPDTALGLGSREMPASHVYADNGTYTVTLTVTDDDGGTDTTSFTVTVDNVAPTVDAGVDQTANEGAVVSLAPATFNDLGTLDTHTVTIAWGDGTPEDTTGVSEVPFGPPGSTDGANGTVDSSHIYADNGIYTVTVTVTDDDGGVGTDTLIMTVDNVAPTVDAGLDQTVDEGDEVHVAATFNDKGTLDTHAYDAEAPSAAETTIVWGDGIITDGAVSENPFGPPGSTAGADGTVSGSHVYADNGSYTVTVTVTDDDGAPTSDQFTVTVLNVAPTVQAGADQTVDEGDLVSLNPATFNDLGTLDTYTATVNWGDGTLVDTGTVAESPFGPPGSIAGADGTVSASHTFADNGTYTVTVTVTDDDGGVGTDTLTVTVYNVVPALTAGPNVEVVIHDDVALAPTSFTDPGFDSGDCDHGGTCEDFTAVINWGEGPGNEPMTVAETPGSPGTLTSGTATAGEHIYRLPDLYTVTVTVIDDDDGIGTATSTVKVLGARDLKERAIGLIDDYVDDSTFIEKAIDNINSSLEDRRWLDTVHLDPDHGHRVYSEEKQAYVQLANAIGLAPGNANPKKGGSPLSGTAVDAVHDAIDLLVNADRVIAITQLLDAQALPPAEPKAEKKVLAHVDRAERELAQGDAARAAGDFIKAIDSYRSAWHFASLAVDLAEGPQTYRRGW